MEIFYVKDAKYCIDFEIVSMWNIVVIADATKMEEYITRIQKKPAKFLHELWICAFIALEKKNAFLLRHVHLQQTILTIG